MIITCQPLCLALGCTPRKAVPALTAVAMGHSAAVSPSPSCTHCAETGSRAALRAVGHVNKRLYVLWASQYLYSPSRAVDWKEQRDYKMPPVLKPEVTLEERGPSVPSLQSRAEGRRPWEEQGPGQSDQQRRGQSQGCRRGAAEFSMQL